ncbi:hypothetical protein JL720_3201 [Aureococcus anophagefferens]|nr:hypothetical protein JL720_3201 [Aureococcus anophagefferens]
MAASTAPAASATASSTDDATARHLWHVAIATRPGDDGEDELYAAEATTKGAVLLTIAKTDATMLPIHRGDTVQVGAHEHCVLGAAGALLVATRRPRRTAPPPLRSAPTPLPLATCRRRALKVDPRATEWRLFAACAERERARLLAAGAARDAERPSTALGATRPPSSAPARRTRPTAPPRATATSPSSTATATRRSRRSGTPAATSSLAPSPLSPSQACAMGFAEEVRRVLGTLDADDAAALADARCSCLRKAPVHAVVAGLRQTRADCDFEGTAAALADAGALVDARDLLGRTPLFCLVATSYDPGSDKKAKALALLDVLLKRGADPNAEDRAGMVPLFGPAKENKVDIVTALLQRGADAHRPFRFFRQSTMEASLSQHDAEEVHAVPEGGLLPVDCQKASWKTHKRYCVPAGKKKAPPAGSASVAAVPTMAAPATAAPAAESPAAVADEAARLARELDAESAPSDKAGFETFAAKTEAFLAKYG